MHSPLLLSLFLALLMGIMTCSRCQAQRIVAHRGASFDYPENTLLAFRKAWEMGADGIEGDFYLTADGHIVCIHDKNTRRTGGKNLIVEQSTLDALKQLEYGSWKSAEFRGEPLPTLEDVYRTVPSGKLFVIELKSDSAIVQPFVEELRRLQMAPEQVLIISFHEEVIRRCKQLAPEYRGHWLTSTSPRGDRQPPSVEQIAAAVKRSQADGVGLEGNPQVVTEDFLDALRRLGVTEFHVWTIDDPETARYFQRLGALSITTNRPDIIGRSLQRPSP
ncbi:MAG: glycerophosphoryl diester phosphodiesterase [Pirellulaceae bacterium]|nr:MAG: glycerophosphoryl diester phosphodiesterase [Pirellulaceae bacterium]